VDPTALSRVLPSPFRPKLYDGVGIAGVCMIRFRGLRPRGLPSWLGLGSENAAHRIAVEWEADGVRQEGVFIPQRNTNSIFNRILGGRIFPGIFTEARFDSTDTDDEVGLRIVNPDRTLEVAFRGTRTERHSADSIFPSLDVAAGFFSLGATGYSATHRPDHYHGMTLHSLDWRVAPLIVHEHHSRFFTDRTRFPTGTVELDCALLMRSVPHEWHSRPDVFTVAGGASLSSGSRGVV
jgi:hypothetical protein